MKILIGAREPRLAAAWERAFEGAARIHCIADRAALADWVARHQPELALLSVSLLGAPPATTLNELRVANPEIRIIALDAVIDSQREEELILAGASACCTEDVAPDHLSKVARAVLDGEVWMSRSRLGSMLDTLRARQRAGDVVLVRQSGLPAARLDVLTPREMEVASMIGQSVTNKSIARELRISERTVKMHLSQIFRKLGIADRVQLALIVGHQRRN